MRFKPRLRAILLRLGSDFDRYDQSFALSDAASLSCFVRSMASGSGDWSSTPGTAARGTKDSAYLA